MKDNKIVRVRPLHYDWQYDKNQFSSWKYERNGVTYEPIMKTLPGPFSVAYKKRAYSPNRIKFPLIREDWDPSGERNPQNRGKSKYKRISWDKVTDIIAGEIRRIHQEYGPYAILAQVDGHAENKWIHGAHGQPTQLLYKMGGFTQQIRNPDSWEGWYWGARHVWGNGFIGLMPSDGALVKDTTDNTQLVLFWGCDPETTSWGFTGQTSSRLCYFWSELGIKQVYVCPDLNYGAAIHADKWIPILPNTDAALQLAIIYVWITENIYDKEYVATHAVGMDKVEEYVLGKEDGVPKTPEWASSKCGVPEWTIKALAREFASQTTSISHVCGGSYIRGPYSTEPARLEVILLGMQGLGKPGVHQFNFSIGSMPASERPSNPRTTQLAAYIGPAYNEPTLAPISNTVKGFTKQQIPKTLIQDAILNPPITYWGDCSHIAPVEDQFVKYTFPIPKDQGGTEIHMIWTDTPCRTTCWNDGNKTVEAMKSPKIECIIAQHPWLENDCLLADIILPANTTFEVDDIMTNTGDELATLILQKQAIQPLGESMSDREIVLEIAKKLGKCEEITQGKTSEEWIRYVFEEFGYSEFLSWEQFQNKQYVVFPIVKDWDKFPAGMINFYNDPENNPLPTPSGKLEFYSERLAKNFPDDTERPPIPKWIERSETHDERISGEMAKKYPLLQMSNHGRWRMHAQCDDISWTRECPTCKVKGPDGYMYEPVWIHPKTAAERGIKSGDIVKVYNDRGTVLCGAYVTERMMPGVLSVDHGSRCDWIAPGKIDRGGAIDLICPTGIISKHATGEATSGFLVEAKKVNMAQMEEWKKQYPEAFEREYDANSGLCFDGWVR